MQWPVAFLIAFGWISRSRMSVSIAMFASRISSRVANVMFGVSPGPVIRAGRCAGVVPREPLSLSLSLLGEQRGRHRPRCPMVTFPSLNLADDPFTAVLQAMHQIDRQDLFGEARLRSHPDQALLGFQ